MKKREPVAGATADKFRFVAQKSWERVKTWCGVAKQTSVKLPQQSRRFVQTLSLLE